MITLDGAYEKLPNNGYYFNNASVTPPQKPFSISDHLVLLFTLHPGMTISLPNEIGDNGGNPRD